MSIFAYNSAVMEDVGLKLQTKWPADEEKYNGVPFVSNKLILILPS